MEDEIAKCKTRFSRVAARGKRYLICVWQRGEWRVNGMQWNRRRQQNKHLGGKKNHRGIMIMVVEWRGMQLKQPRRKCYKRYCIKQNSDRNENEEARRSARRSVALCAGRFWRIAKPMAKSRQDVVGVNCVKDANGNYYHRATITACIWLDLDDRVRGKFTWIDCTLEIRVGSQRFEMNVKWR